MGEVNKCQECEYYNKADELCYFDGKCEVT